MQSVLDERILHFQYVIVEFVHLVVHIVGGASFIQSKVGDHVEFDAQLNDLVHYRRQLLAEAEVLSFEIGLYGCLQFVNLIVSAGTGHGWDHMCGSYSILSAFGLHPFTGIVDYVWVDVGKFPQNYIWIAFLRQSDAFSGKPFQCAVCSHVNDGIRTPYLLQPSVYSEVLMRRGRPWIMIRFC